MVRNISETYTKSIAITTTVGGTGTWTKSYAGNILINTVDVADQNATLAVPLAVSKLNDSGEMSTDTKISTIEVSYTVGVAALETAVLAEIQSVAKAVDGAAPVVTTIAATVAGGGVATNSKTVDDHLITITPDTNAIMTGDSEYILELTFDQAGTTTLVVTGVKVNYKELNS